MVNISGTIELANSPNMAPAGTEGVSVAKTTKIAVDAETQSGIQVISVPNSWDDAWELIHALVVHINASKDEVTIVVSLGMDSQEYGVASSLDEATSDLLTSLSDYYQFLTKHENELGPSEEAELKVLQTLVRPLNPKE